MRKLLKRVVCSVMAVVLGASSSIPAFADNPCSRYPKNSNEYQQCWIEFAGQNNILFYDPAGGGTECNFGSLSGDDVTIVGDSISVGATSEYRSQIPGVDLDPKTIGGVTYNLTKVGKHFSKNVNYESGGYGGTTIAEVLKGNGQLRRYLVFALGTNDANSISEEQIKDLLDIVGSDHGVVLVTNYAFNNRLDFSSNNEVIRSAGEKYSNVVVADWAAELEKSSNPEQYSSDGYVHLNTEGSRLFVGLIRQALNSLAGVNYSSGPLGVSGATIEEKIWSGLTGFLSAEQAAGVMGNMYYESGLNPAMHEQSLKNNHQPGFDLGANEKVSYGIGLVQWSFSRRVNLYNYIKEQDSSLLQYFNEYEKYAPNYGVDGRKFLEIAGAEATDKLISVELEFLKDEIETYESYKPLLSQNTVYDAAKYFLERIEVPNNPTIEAHMNRVEKAEEYYEKYKNYSGSVCNYTDAGRLIEYVKLYAWPTYHSPQYLERTEAYAEAVKRRSDSGLWTGGSVRGVAGIDCGGFVTTVLNESGYDVNYNYGGDPGAGAAAISGGQLVYISSHGDEWQMVNESVSTPVSDESALRPGDVAFSDCSGNAVESLKCEHTYLYIGEVEGFETHIASASYSSDGTGGRSPMSGMEDFKYGGSSVVVWFRKVK